MLPTELSSDLKEFYRHVFRDTTKTVAKVKEGTTKVLDRLDDHIMSEFLTAWDEKDVVAEAEYRRSKPEIYTTPLPDVTEESTKVVLDGVSEVAFEFEETRMFLDSFDIHEKTDEIASLLDEYPDSVRVQFETLVPMEVSYVDFWQRYFYRCDVGRIERAWTAHDDRRSQNRQQAVVMLKQTANPVVSVVTTPIKVVMGSMRQKAEIEVEIRRELEDVYTTPLLTENIEDNEEEKLSINDFELKETREFLESFDIQHKTEEIADLLKNHADVKAFFEELVPVHVSYECFWQRYFVRCDPDMIVRAWKENDKNVMNARKETVKAWTSKLSRPVSFVTSPLKSTIRSLSFSDDTATTTTQGEDTTKNNDTQPVSQEEVTDAQKKLAESNDRIQALRARLKESKKRLAEAEKRVGGLKTDLGQARCKLLDNGEAGSVSLTDTDESSLTATDGGSTTSSNSSVESVSSITVSSTSECQIKEVNRQPSSPTAVLGKFSVPSASILKLAGMWREAAVPEDEMVDSEEV